MSKADSRRRAARAAGLLGLAKIEGIPDPHVETPIPEAQWPKKFMPGQLQIGDSVFYSGERYYIEAIPPDWSISVMARISDIRGRAGLPATQKRLAFCVPVDSLELAPVAKGNFNKQPTAADVERKVRAEQGLKDVGDPVAEKLRECNGIDEVYWLTAKLLNVPEDELKAKYAHLNPGQQRMNCGNRLRGAIKRGLIKL